LFFGICRSAFFSATLTVIQIVNNGQPFVGARVFLDCNSLDGISKKLHQIQRNYLNLMTFPERSSASPMISKPRLSEEEWHRPRSRQSPGLPSFAEPRRFANAAFGCVWLHIRFVSIPELFRWREFGR